MSAAPIYEPIVEPKARTPIRPQQRTYPVDLPTLRVVENPRPQRIKAQTVHHPSAALQVGIFACVMALMYLTSNLVGQVMVEKARRDGIRALARARTAVRESAVLRERVQLLSSGAAIDTWAASNRFVQSGAGPEAAKVKNLVALR